MSSTVQLALAAIMGAFAAWLAKRGHPGGIPLMLVAIGIALVALIERPGEAHFQYEAFVLRLPIYIGVAWMIVAAVREVVRKRRTHAKV